MSNCLLTVRFLRDLHYEELKGREISFCHEKDYFVNLEGTKVYSEFLRCSVDDIPDDLLDLAVVNHFEALFWGYFTIIVR